jgi:hypothetical protein
VDIAAVNGTPILGHQGPGSITDTVLREVLRLQGTMAPEELISLEELGGPSFALPDHNDHIHIGWQPMYSLGHQVQFVGMLKPDQWNRLIGRLGEIDNPEVPTEPSPASVPDKAKAGKDLGGAKVAKSGGTESGD